MDMALDEGRHDELAAEVDAGVVSRLCLPDRGDGAEAPVANGKVDQRTVGQFRIGKAGVRQGGQGITIVGASPQG